jgi:hypothetical protein
MMATEHKTPGTTGIPRANLKRLFDFRQLQLPAFRRNPPRRVFRPLKPFQDFTEGFWRRILETKPRNSGVIRVWPACPSQPISPSSQFRRSLRSGDRRRAVCAECSTFRAAAVPYSNNSE